MLYQLFHGSSKSDSDLAYTLLSEQRLLYTFNCLLYTWSPQLLCCLCIYRGIFWEFDFHDKYIRICCVSIWYCWLIALEKRWKLYALDNSFSKCVQLLYMGNGLLWKGSLYVDIAKHSWVTLRDYCFYCLLLCQRYFKRISHIGQISKCMLDYTIQNTM